jgi:putative phosphoribosyl transferase
MLDSAVAIPIGASATLTGHCRIPPGATGLVAFVHGSGSSRHSPRNRQVADYLNDQGLGTLLFDLLTEDEGRRRQNVFDIDLLADRVAGVRTWLATDSELSSLSLGLFGASTGAAAALVSAASQPQGVAAIVSRGGRVDLAGRWLGKVLAPTLFIVGGDDQQVLVWNEESARQLQCEHRLEAVPGATHLFEEPGALETVAELAGSWFLDHMRAASQSIIR